MAAHDLVPLADPKPIATRLEPPVDLLSMALAGLMPQSKIGYTKDLNALARFLSVESAAATIARLYQLTQAQANAMVAAWVESMVADGLSPATVRRRVAAVARVYQVGRRFGLSEATPEARLPRSEPLRDTSGPGKRGWERMLAFAVAEAGTGKPRATRDLAIALLLHDRGLRRGELANLDWPSDFDAARPAVAVLGKGKSEKVWLTISRRSADAVSAWASTRGDWEGPLFTRVDPAAKSPDRLTGQGVNELVRRLARRAGLPRAVRAHGLRHQAVTEALDQGWKVRDVMAFSRHVDPRTVMLYDDRRRDVGGEISRSLGHEKRAPRRRG